MPPFHRTFSCGTLVMNLFSLFFNVMVERQLRTSRSLPSEQGEVGCN